MNGKAKVGIVAGVVTLGMLNAGTAVAAPAGGMGIAVPTARSAAAAVDRAGSASYSAAAKPVKCVSSVVCDLRKKKFIGKKCKLTQNKMIANTEGRGPTTLVISKSRSVSAEVETTIGVDYDLVSAEVGFKVTKSYSVEIQTRYEVSKGRMGYVEAYPCYKVYTFEVWSKAAFGAEEKFLGFGHAAKPVGVHFKQWTKKA
ncbi:hypothetical protein EDD27_4538 [Nonomuraea polychroma]|uniref:Uncharacterized protein n=1 Tax=Nonomuraea polychroma TaxID=46176 RepID=A0A438M877_9ACTN|nr:hypothetical protein [Nonomuraea polychroma]RVX41931.1 hypothetical protein EDD27_4538 [Nonomuraea polychroma]